MTQIDTSREAIKRLKEWRDVGKRASDNYCAGTATFGADVVALLAHADTLTRERDEALAREAALREALEPFAATDQCSGLSTGQCRVLSCMKRAGWSLGSGVEDGMCDVRKAHAALTSTATVAAARDAALVARGQADGLRMAAQIDEGRLSDAREQGRREGIEEAARVVIDYPIDAIPQDELEVGEREVDIAAAIRALAAPPAD